MASMESISQAVIQGDETNLNSLIKQAVDGGESPQDILHNGLIAAMDIVGNRMENGEMFIPEVLMAAKTMSSGLALLKPLLGDSGIGVNGKVIIGTVKGDLHDIGKNLVAMMLESAGFEVIDLGVDVEPKRFATEVVEKKANVLCLSALLTTTMPMMKETIDTLSESGIRDGVKVMVGGAPVTSNFADEIGADGYAADAGSAAKLAKSLI